MFHSSDSVEHKTGQAHLAVGYSVLLANSFSLQSTTLDLLRVRAKDNAKFQREGLPTICSWESGLPIKAAIALAINQLMIPSQTQGDSHRQSIS